MKVYPLRTFIYRVLLVRLGIASASIALVMGLLTYAILRAQLKGDVADLGRRGVSTLIEKVRSEMELRQNDAVTALRDVLGRGEPPVVYRARRVRSVQGYGRAAA